MEWNPFRTGPEQSAITPDRIAEMVDLKPRRVQFTTSEWGPIQQPSRPGNDPVVKLPFCETLSFVFEEMCNAEHIGMREDTSSRRCYTYLKGETAEAAIQPVEEWLHIVGKYVAIRDCLAVSYALDFDRVAGDPNQPQTRIGQLRVRAKPYGGPATPDTLQAADELVAELLTFLREMTCYNHADAVVAMPASDPGKPFDLPAYLAEGIAAAGGRPNLSQHVRTVRERPPLKNTPVSDKLVALTGTVSVGEEVRGKSILLVDDLYQSGVSMNYVAMELLNAGADVIMGLACEKTCRNDDNTARVVQ